MSQVFISYRRQDSSEIARQIFTWLAERYPPQEVFMDTRSIPPGVDFRASIEQAIISSSTVLAVIGSGWLHNIDRSDDYVRYEIEMALRHDKGILPLLVGGARMPTNKNLPSSIAALAYRQAIQVSSDWGFEESMQLVKQHIASSVSEGKLAPRDVEMERKSDWGTLNYRLRFALLERHELRFTCESSGIGWFLTVNFDGSQRYHEHVLGVTNIVRAIQIGDITVEMGFTGVLFPLRVDIKVNGHQIM